MERYGGFLYPNAPLKAMWSRIYEVIMIGKFMARNKTWTGNFDIFCLIHPAYFNNMTNSFPILAASLFAGEFGFGSSKRDLNSNHKNFIILCIYACFFDFFILALRFYSVRTHRLNHPATTPEQFAALVFHTRVCFHGTTELPHCSLDYSDSDRSMWKWGLSV
ncbi:hypothetical protein BpHYR1_013573 [Brachionus plicatilis]|uniref:Uncharacterized protein n=1 Tax=Brachionus plicatilis TaxID=10195 RepID=A0A3M7Q9J0_BRAPC|nr:hypothetical protein BpHYR1_013573 [Brachionus plicatilis]